MISKIEERMTNFEQKMDKRLDDILSKVETIIHNAVDKKLDEKNGDVDAKIDTAVGKIFNRYIVKSALLFALFGTLGGIAVHQINAALDDLRKPNPGQQSPGTEATKDKTEKEESSGRNEPPPGADPIPAVDNRGAPPNKINQKKSPVSEIGRLPKPTVRPTNPMPPAKLR